MEKAEVKCEMTQERMEISQELSQERDRSINLERTVSLLREQLDVYEVSMLYHHGSNYLKYEKNKCLEFFHTLLQGVPKNAPVACCYS